MVTIIGYQEDGEEAINTEPSFYGISYKGIVFDYYSTIEAALIARRSILEYLAELN